MKLKYYLRGLGLGVAVTAFVMSRIMSKEELTDAQIKLRAMELGMVEETVLAKLPQGASEKADNDKDKKNMNKETADDETKNNAEIMNNTEESNQSSQENMENIFHTVGEAEILEQVEIPDTTKNKQKTDVSSSEVSENQEIEEILPTQSQEQQNQENSEAILESPVEHDVSEEVIESYVVIAIEQGNGSETVSRKLYNAGLVESAVQFNRFLVQNGYDRNLNVGTYEIPIGSTEEELAKILCGLQ